MIQSKGLILNPANILTTIFNPKGMFYNISKLNNYLTLKIRFKLPFDYFFK